MNAIDLLVDHHRRLEKKLKDALEKCCPVAQALDELVAHVTAEEEIFYPAVKADRTEDILLESLEEHLALKRLVSDFLSLTEDDQQYEPKLHVLKEQVEHHHKEEEEHLFPKVKKCMKSERLDALGDEMKRMMDDLMKREPRRLVVSQTKAAAPLA
jgi:hemerythrin superfamily protein